jgi:dimethylglycine dehydrogenase
MSRAILGTCTEAALDNGSFRWLSARHIAVAGVEDVRALRLTYTGELGWELHVPMAGMYGVYDTLVAAGEPLGMVHVGAAALNAMRMEKGYKSGHELTNEVTLAEAKVTRFARPTGFQGAEVGLAEPKTWALAYLQLEEPSAGGPNADPLGSESVWAEGECVGAIASGGFGYGVSAYLAWAYVKPAWAAPGTELQVTVLGELRSARVLAEPVWDPENLRPRADGRLARKIHERVPPNPDSAL